MKRVSIVFVICLVAIIPQSCSNEGKSDHVRLALQTEPATLDPAYSVDYSSGMVSSA